MTSVFISHSHSDRRLAERLQMLIEQSSSRTLQVDRSSDDGAIKAGEDWRAWIDDKILSCDLAIVLLTPSSFRGRWVLWEAGAVAGVQYERLKGQAVSSGAPGKRRVQVVKFNVDEEDLGPFANTQTVNGLHEPSMTSFMRQVLLDYVDPTTASKGFIMLREEVQHFQKGALEDLRFTPIAVTEGLVQDWLVRLDKSAEDKDDNWIVAAKRWINITFLGAGRANAHQDGEAIDFRIHIRIAAAHRRLRDWGAVVEQLQLAAKLSPNNMVVLRDLGRAYRERGDTDALRETMAQMALLDPEIFKKDREGIALRCGYLTKQNAWADANKLLAEADYQIVNNDSYLANWRAVAAMKALGPNESLPYFRELKTLTKRTGGDFWNQATLINACLALGELAEAEQLLGELGLNERSADEVDSATRFYDEILQSFGRTFEWKKAAHLS